VPRWFWLPALLLVGLRFLHLGPELDDPHMWRQADTAYYIWDYYINGIDFLHPAVCWMGGYKTVALEFPLPEALSAWAYQLLGPDLVWSRLICLGFYLGAAFYFFKVIRHVFDAEMAAFATLVFLMLPLGIYYSRAVHIDFCAVFFAHAMLYYLLRAVDLESRWLFVLAMLMATMGFLVKVPYVFYLAIPAVAYIHHDGKWRFFLSNSFLLLIPLLTFAAWQWHVKRVNAAAPDWTFIPDYHKMDNQLNWYFGHLSDRREWPYWQLIWGRLKFEVAAVIGVPLLLLGGMLGFKQFRINFMRLWAIGSLCYLLIFFMLNFHHDYYQIPFLAPFAFFIALPLYFLHQFIARQNRAVAGLVMIVVMSLFGWQCIRLTEGIHLSNDEKNYLGMYYQPDPLPQKAGGLIREHTPDNTLVISTFGGLDARCPLILYHARRLGWSIGKQHLSVSLLTRLVEEGATHFALLQKDPLDVALEQFVAQFPLETYLLPGTDWPLRIYELKGK
jgi:Dolichyl-phosphate-mannose-protein mannosyltransferase